MIWLPIYASKSHEIKFCVKLIYFYRTAGAISMRIAYGYRVKERNDPFLTDVEIAVEQFSLSTAPGGFLVNLVPSRVYLFDVMRRNVLPNSWKQCDIYQLGFRAQVSSTLLPFGQSVSLTWLNSRISLLSNRW